MNISSHEQIPSGGDTLDTCRADSLLRERLGPPSWIAARSATHSCPPQKGKENIFKTGKGYMYICIVAT